MIKRFLLSSMLVAILVAAPSSVYAFNPFGGGACSAAGAQNSVACSTSNADPISGTDGLLIKITQIIAFIAGAVAVAIIIVSAIRFITSGSNVSTGSRTDTDVEDAKRSIAGALIGIAIIALAQTIIVYFIRRL